MLNMRSSARHDMRAWSIAVVCASVIAVSAAEAQSLSDLARRQGAVDENYPDHRTIYDAVAVPGAARVRLIVTAPDKQTSVPTVFLAGWLSCDTVESPPKASDSIARLLQRLAAMPDFALIRMDKPGVGDSEGDCSKTDFLTELTAYRTAFQKMLQYGFVDRSRIFILGLSNGGGFAPLVPQGVPIRGYVVEGGWVKTWFEHMMEIERRRLGLTGKSAGEVNSLMHLEARLYTEFLINGKSPAELLAHNRELTAVWAGQGNELYGRPHQYYQQLQHLNLAEAWSQVNAPTLVMHGEFDWIMSEADHRMIAELVNTNRAGVATFVSVPHADHSLANTTSYRDSFSDHVGPFDVSIADRITDWLAAHK
jgi:pimeloyl-ACP methyl ester carboxylesterase